MKRFKPKLVAVRNESLVNELKEAIADCEEKPEIIPGEEGVVEVSFLSPFFLKFNIYFSIVFTVTYHRCIFLGCQAPRCCDGGYRDSRLCWIEGI